MTWATTTSALEEAFAGQLRMLFLDRGWDQEAIQREYRFSGYRRWKADFAIDTSGVKGVWKPWSLGSRMQSVEILLIEIEGGTRSGGRHNRHDGYTNDAYKYSAASALGYTVLRGTSQMVNDGTLLKMVEEVLLGELKIEDWKAV